MTRNLTDVDSRALLANADVGGYTLPAELVEAAATHQAILALQIDPPVAVEVDTAAAQVVALTAAGEAVDLLEVGRRTGQGARDRADHDQAQAILRAAVEQAAERAAGIAYDLAEAIIAEHLRPALDEVHQQTRQAAQAIGEYALEPMQLLRAPAKVRTAYLSLAPLVARRTAIYEARRLANSIGHREPQHDDRHLFAMFRKPLAFHPDWSPPTQVPMLPLPEDSTDQLLFMVSDQAQAAQPWLPTVAEQDAAWWEEFGDAQRARADGARFVRGLVSH